MLQYAATFLIMAVIAAFLGYGSLAGLVAEIAKVLFLVFLALFILSFVFTGPNRRN